MRLCVLTSHNPRHYFVANSLAKLADETLVVSSAMGLNPAKAGHHGRQTEDLLQYFEDRFLTEEKFFKDRIFRVHHGGVIVVGPHEINSNYVEQNVRSFQPDVIVVFGTNILKSGLLSITDKILNIHLGVSPYYNGSSTNFWPMYNGEFEFVGVTVHFIDKGVDTGPIIGHTRAIINSEDTPHTIGNKTIIAGVKLINDILPVLARHHVAPVKQWVSEERPIYRMKDFDDKVLDKFISNLKTGMIGRWVKSGNRRNFDLVDFNFGKP